MNQQRNLQCSNRNVITYKEEKSFSLIKNVRPMFTHTVLHLTHSCISTVSGTATEKSFMLRLYNISWELQHAVIFYRDFAPCRYGWGEGTSRSCIFFDSTNELSPVTTICTSTANNVQHLNSPLALQKSAFVFGLTFLSTTTWIQPGLGNSALLF